MQVIQSNRTTSRNRYPEIFKAVRQLNESPERILSYGCGPGDELFTLLKYFKNSHIFGYDLRPVVLSKKRSNIKVLTKLDDQEPFDVVFAMSVLCRWPELLKQKDSSKIFPFSLFQEAIDEIDPLIKPGGLFVIYNTNYAFENCKQADNYTPFQLTHIPAQYLPLYSPRGNILSWKPKAYIYYKKETSD